jgi:putative hydrolase of the HAD superfamily
VIEAVVFDLGGVVMESPLRAIARYERDHGLAAGAISRVVAAAGDGGAWARLERGELTAESFRAPFEAEGRTSGIEVDAARMMADINNWVGADGCPTDGLQEHFDVFVESAAVGLRKPDPRIYELTCRLLGVAPPRAAFLDDIGQNLKAARALGMATIKVEDPDHALRELAALLGMDLIAEQA